MPKISGMDYSSPLPERLQTKMQVGHPSNEMGREESHLGWPWLWSVVCQELTATARGYKTTCCVIQSLKGEEGHFFKTNQSWWKKKPKQKNRQPTTRQAFKHASLVFSMLPCLSLCVITARTVVPQEYLSELRIADFLEKCFCLFWFCVFKFLEPWWPFS